MFSVALKIKPKKISRYIMIGEDDSILLNRESPRDLNKIGISAGIAVPISGSSEESDIAKSPEHGYSFPTEIVLDEDSDETSNPTPVSSISQRDDEKHHSVWSPIWDGQKRCISHGDLKYDLGDRVVAVLPIYYGDDGLEYMSVVIGEIVDIISRPVSQDEDVPRQSKLRSSPDSKPSRKFDATGAVDSEGNSIYVDNKPANDWSDALINTDSDETLCQTMVIEYVLKLDDKYALTDKQVSNLTSNIHKNSKLPYAYDLKFDSTSKTGKKKSSRKIRRRRGSNNSRSVRAANNTASTQNVENKKDLITIPYRYVMGTEHACTKDLNIQDAVRKTQFHSGIYVRYKDISIDMRTYNVVCFEVVDHICVSPFNIKYVIRCDGEPVRILPISKCRPFDVRLQYEVDGYHIFHPLDRYNYTTLDFGKIDEKEAIWNIISDIFSDFKVYVVQKSLCRPEDLDYKVYQDANGNVKYIRNEKCRDERGFSPDDELGNVAGPVTRSSNPMRGFIDSGITVTKYAKGLAYPEGNCPTQNDQYIFFHSKDYYELDMNPESNTFMLFVPTSGSHALYRNPLGKDRIIAETFVCDRDQYKGKMNLRWFYPTPEFRLLHLYISTKGQHPQFATTNNQRSAKRDRTDVKNIRSMFTDHHLSVIDLLLFGLDVSNPTLDSPFTQRFISEYVWWHNLKSN